MDTKEMLELAAKACGMDVWFPRMNGGRNMDGTRIILTPCHTKRGGVIVEWNPPEDDGDCFRMECQLGIDGTWPSKFVAMSQVNNITVVELYDDNTDSKAAARRLASTRVAAEIGRGTE